MEYNRIPLPTPADAIWLAGTPSKRSDLELEDVAEVLDDLIAAPYNRDAPPRRLVELRRGIRREIKRRAERRSHEMNRDTY